MATNQNRSEKTEAAKESSHRQVTYVDANLYNLIRRAISHIV